MSIKTDKKVPTPWDAAIKDAMRHIFQLRAAIAVFEEMKAAGKPWPGHERVKRQLREQRQSS